MKSKPVRKYASPKYPTRPEVAAQPDLLRRHLPPAWRKWPELTGAVGLFLLADPARLSAAEGSTKDSQASAQSKAVAIVAPVFQHGEGRGATGCIVMAPPVFLSEEEALQVIRKEMAANGVQLGTNQTTVAGITVERFAWSVPPTPAGATKGTKPPDPTIEIKHEPFKADVADPKKKVFVEFLGERDADRWDLERGTIVSTVHSYDLPKTAGYVAERVKRQATDKLYFGTFYDPMAGTLDFRKPLAEKTSPSRDQLLGAIEDAKVESRRLLRMQVQDFLKWLQAQGAI